MHTAKVLATLAAMSVTVTTFSLPDNAVDGDYIAYYNSTGHKVHERVTSPDDLLVERDFADPAGLERRWRDIRPGFFCGCANLMNEVDYVSAISALKAQYDGSTGRLVVPQGMSAYSIRKSVVAFLCNPQRCKTVYLY